MMNENSLTLDEKNHQEGVDVFTCVVSASGSAQTTEERHCVHPRFGAFRDSFAVGKFNPQLPR